MGSDHFLLCKTNSEFEPISTSIYIQSQSITRQQAEQAEKIENRQYAFKIIVHVLSLRCYKSLS